MLKVRDPRISASSLAVLFNKSRISLGSSTPERITVLADGDDAYTWDRAANLLGVPVAQVQSWICAGQLQVVDSLSPTGRLRVLQEPWGGAEGIDD